MFMGEGLGSAEVQDFAPRWRPVTGDRWFFPDLVLAKWLRGCPKTTPGQRPGDCIGICGRPALFTLALGASIRSYLVPGLRHFEFAVRWAGRSLCISHALVPQCYLQGVYFQNLGQGARPRPKFWCLGWVTQHAIGRSGVIVSKYPRGLEPSDSGLPGRGFWRDFSSS